jgi:hypothetical protein
MTVSSCILSGTFAFPPRIFQPFMLASESVLVDKLQQPTRHSTI